jgi:hypothetical protein
MITKVYLNLTKDQRDRKVYFSSTLSTAKFETSDATRHEITSADYLKDWKASETKEGRLRNDEFFNNSHFKFNIIRS